MQNVEFVVNYDLPETSENYVHRVGRTGRGTQKGQAISFCSTEEKEHLQLIEDNLGKPINRMELSKSDYQYTLDMTEDITQDWKVLLKDAEADKKKFKKKNKKKK